MTETTPAPVPSASGDDAGFETMRNDAVLCGRAMSSGEFLAGLIANAQLETVGRPDKLARDLWPDADPVLIQAVWDRALAVGFHAGRVSAAPRMFRDQLDRLAGVFAKAGFHAMAGSVARSRRLVAPEAPPHPADGETEHGH
ncbi:hypothetical protein DMH12_15285 [Streptomyces sp. WAC 04229]|uniref:hypothetical protein n=1 Tax=Streptomyces sp. WAC 04229 TaxID=2203206 RepID=UPI000F740D73|nr:hypothetical protein [Streptomyces sp. WAC 04229]RSN55580.1 hypothetical protein DMH12_15285 [Streptomyces sp. WAC 04229]